MSNIFESSDLFEASIRFENAASRIEKLSESPSDLDDKDRDALQWAGELLQSVDWNSELVNRQHVSPATAARATSIRPFFYNVLLDTKEEFERSGLTNEHEIRTFCSALYQLLRNGTRPSEVEFDYDLAAGVLHRISEGLLLEVTGNGHSKFGGGTLTFWAS